MSKKPLLKFTAEGYIGVLRGHYYHEQMVDNKRFPAVVKAESAQDLTGYRAVRVLVTVEEVRP